MTKEVRTNDNGGGGGTAPKTPRGLVYNTQHGLADSQFWLLLTISMRRDFEAYTSQNGESSVSRLRSVVGYSVVVQNHHQ